MVIEDDVFDCRGAVNVVGHYKADGSAGVSQSQRQIEFWKERLAKR